MNRFYQYLIKYPIACSLFCEYFDIKDNGFPYKDLTDFVKNPVKFEDISGYFISFILGRGVSFKLYSNGFTAKYNDKVVSGNAETSPAIIKKLIIFSFKMIEDNE